MNPQPNRLLKWVGLGLLAVAALGFLMDRSPIVVTAFAILGTALAVFSVFEPRMEGPQHLGVRGVTFTLRELEDVRAIAVQAEKDVVVGNVYPMEDLT